MYNKYIIDIRSRASYLECAQPGCTGLILVPVTPISLIQLIARQVIGRGEELGPEAVHSKPIVGLCWPGQSR